ncbi:MAG TPA: hypothetical protein VHW09_01150 [Bryobacteraceae bacterium]|jgi:hypothetical protein|nr:hypothetical protein [Bryobacteraceae bacterium]
MARLTTVARILTGLLFVCAATAQLPRVGNINFYGLHATLPDQILTAAHLGPGDTLPASRIDLEDRIIGLPGVMDANVQSVCCDGDRATLFIGIQERGQAGIEFRVPPSGTATLPAELMTRYRKYSGALMRSEVKGGAADTSVHREEEYFRLYTASHTLKLRAVLRTGPDAEQRAAAVTVLACATNKRLVVDDLLFALLDSDDGVRAAALRQLATIAALAHQRPSLGIRIPPAGMVDLLNSVVLSDRVEATKTLLALTAKPDNAALDLIRERALPSLAEMARWQTRSYAEAPFQLLARIAGLRDEDAIASWEHGDPEPVIQQALDSARKPGLQ